MLTKTELSPHALHFFESVKNALPTEISSRLRSSRHFVTHPTIGTLFLFDIWDQKQTDILPAKHFKYCLGYDKRPGSATDGYFHLWLTKIRIYGEHENIRKSILAKLGCELPKTVPREFTDFSANHERAFDFALRFNYPKDLNKFPNLLLPKAVKLISAVHPILVTIIDNFTRSLAPKERRAIVSRRGRIAFKSTGVIDRQRVREYTRSVPPSWKPIILKQHSFRCALCAVDLKKVTYHIDHIVAFSRGGLTVLENLQPLCSGCNLKKGNR